MKKRKSLLVFAVFLSFIIVMNSCDIGGGRAETEKATDSVASSEVVSEKVTEATVGESSTADKEESSAAGNDATSASSESSSDATGEESESDAEGSVSGSSEVESDTSAGGSSDNPSGGPTESSAESDFESTSRETENESSETQSHTHVFGEWTTVKEASCTEMGEQKRVCSCGEAESLEIEMSAHVEEILPAKAPTREEEGLTEGKKCSVCGEILVAQEIISVIVPAVWEGNIATEFAGGSGTFSDPYLIANGDQLAFLAAAINGDVNNEYHDKYYLLVDDIDLGGLEWTPIGRCHYSSSSYSQNCAFNGVFDGNGYTISNFKITDTSRDYYYYLGLFGYVWEGALKDVGVKDFTIEINYGQNTYVGGLVGYSRGAILGCYVECGSINAEIAKNSLYVGGLIGFSSGTITNCHADINIVGNGKISAGGLLGQTSSNSNTSGCYADGSITVNATVADVGGLIGYLNGAVDASYSNVSIDVEATGNVYAGGLAGRLGADGKIRDTYNAGDVTVSSEGTVCVGGLAGYARSLAIIYTIDRVVCVGNISAEGATVYAGGVLGDSSYADVSNTITLVNVSVTCDGDKCVGAISGNEKVRPYDAYYYNTVTINGVEGVTNEKGTPATSDQIVSESFYIQTLEFYREYWDISNMDAESGKGMTFIIKEHVHSTRTLAAVEVTCTTDGMTEGSYCEACGFYVVPQEIITAPGHTEVVCDYRPASCSEYGATRGKICSVCDEILIQSTGIQKLPHAYYDGICINCGADSRYHSYDYETELKLSQMSLGSDGQYRNADGNPLYITANAPMGWFDGTSLVQFFEWYYPEDAEYFAPLITGYNDAGYIPLTEENLPLVCELAEYSWFGDANSFYFFLSYMEASSSHVHSFTVERIEPTCSESGSAKYVCSECGEGYSLYLNTLTHSFEDGVCTGCGIDESKVWTGNIADSYAGGTGTEEDPYLISTPEQLAYLASQANAGKIRGYYFKLTNDIDLGWMEWDPIGLGYSSDGRESEYSVFLGHFDGDGHTISNFSIGHVKYDYYQYFALFGFVKGSVKNLNVENFDINIYKYEYVYVGGLVANAYESEFVNCHTAGNIYVSSTVGYVTVGGLSAWQGERYENCSYEGTIIVETGYMADVGGVVGSGGRDKMIGCYSSANVIVAKGGAVRVGGVAGSTSNMEKCYSKGLIICDARDSCWIGGLASETDTTKGNKDCYSTVTIVANVSSSWGNTYIGGLFCYAALDQISGCFATGNIRATTNSPTAKIDGFVAYSPKFAVPKCSTVSDTQQIYINGVLAEKNLITMDHTEFNLVRCYEEFMGWNLEEWNLDDLDFANGKTPTLKN